MFKKKVGNIQKNNSFNQTSPALKIHRKGPFFNFELSEMVCIPYEFLADIILVTK